MASEIYNRQSPSVTKIAINPFSMFSQLLYRNALINTIIGTPTVAILNILTIKNDHQLFRPTQGKLKGHSQWSGKNGYLRPQRHLTDEGCSSFVPFTIWER